MQNKNLYGTTVKGDPDKVEAIKKMGYGQLSRAFRIGCDVLLGVATDDIEKLQTHKTQLVHERDVIEAKIIHMSARIDEITLNQEDSSQLTIFANKYVVDEYIRCASDIVYSHKLYLVDYLASLSDTVSAKDVRSFFRTLSTEPTRSEIEKFIAR